MDFVTIITSAATATLVTVAAQLLGQALERRSRRREHILSLALQITQARIEACRERNTIDPLLGTEQCFNALVSLIEGQGIPPNERASTIDLQRMRLRRGTREKARRLLQDRGWERGGPMWNAIMRFARQLDERHLASFPADD